MKRVKWTVYLPNGHVAKFSDFTAALRFARSESLPKNFIEVSAHNGIVAQFTCGVLTGEFKHVADWMIETQEVA